MIRPVLVVVDVALVLLLGGVGMLGVWLLRRHSSLSARNVYVAAVCGLAAFCAAAVAHWWTGVMVLAPATAPAVAGALAGRRWRLQDLGAGDELRRHELARRWVWQPAPVTRVGERKYIGSQGEIVHVRPWPADVEYVPMTARGEQGPRLPLGEGQHVFECGGTGTGKTTTARRLLAARTLAHGAAALLIDQKGDPEDEAELRRIAADAGRPFVLFDPRDSSTDRWQPLWGQPAGCRRAGGGVDQEVRALLRRRAAPAPKSDRRRAPCRGPLATELPVLSDAARAKRYETIAELAARLDPERHRLLCRRVQEHTDWVSSPEGRKDLAGGLVRLELGWARPGARSSPPPPPPTPDGDTVAVGLVEAIRAGAVVMWRTYADDMPDEAAAITVLALADLHAAAGQAGAPWTLMLDEFGSVIHMAAARGVAILQRARSHHGQVIVITQSAADIEALSQQPGLLAPLSDNFTAFVAHRQTAPETRDWLAKLMGTRSLWQSTDQTSGHGAGHSGKGSRRRVREFRIGSDQFASLERGEAVIYTTLGPDPEQASILPVWLPDAQPARIGTGHRQECEILVHSEAALAAVTSVDEFDLGTA